MFPVSTLSLGASIKWMKLSVFQVTCLFIHSFILHSFIFVFDQNSLPPPLIFYRVRQRPFFFSMSWKVFWILKRIIQRLLGSRLANFKSFVDRTRWRGCAKDFCFLEPIRYIFKMSLGRKYTEFGDIDRGVSVFFKYFKTRNSKKEKPL